MNNKQQNFFLVKKKFSLNELRELVNNNLVANITKDGYDKEHKNAPKYSVILENGEIYYVYIS